MFGLSYTDLLMKLSWVTLAVTFIIVEIATFIDCQPLHLYWQVVPDPGTCYKAIKQLVIFGALNIFTDILLIVLPLPALMRVRRDCWALVFRDSIGLQSTDREIERPDSWRYSRWAHFWLLPPSYDYHSTSALLLMAHNK